MVMVSRTMRLRRWRPSRKQGAGRYDCVEVDMPKKVSLNYDEDNRAKIVFRAVVSPCTRGRRPCGAPNSVFHAGIAG
jgi:hypothetical protein